MINIVTERLIIRPITAQDANHFKLVLGDEDVMQYSDDGAMRGAEVSNWVTKQIQDYSTFSKFGRCEV